MRRLIDASVFEVVCFQGKSEEFCEGAKYILEMLDAQPTAFDEEKVIEDIKSLKMSIDGNIFYDEASKLAHEEIIEKVNETIEEVIHIAKSGGV